MLNRYSQPLSGAPAIYVATCTVPEIILERTVSGQLWILRLKDSPLLRRPVHPQIQRVRDWIEVEEALSHLGAAKAAE